MSLTTLGWRLDDFNTEGDTALPEPIDSAETQPEDSGDEPLPAAESWAEGYLHALRHAPSYEIEPYSKIELAVALRKMEENIRQSAESATILVAQLLLDATLAAAGRSSRGDWQDRLQRVADLIKPALLSAVPELTLHNAAGETILTATGIADMAGDPAELASCEGACLSWKLGRADYGRRTAIEDMAWALAPLIVNTVQHDTTTAQKGLSA